jgi:hypothetical protein
LITTPPHPDYVAGHPTFSQAASVVLADFFGSDRVAFTSTSQAYCNTGTPGFDSNGLVISCTQGARTWSVGNPNDCAMIIDGIIANGSPLICPITERFTGFADATTGADGAADSRIWGGIHTPFAVYDGLAMGDVIGRAVAVNAGLPNAVAEPPTLLLLLSAAFFLRAARLPGRNKTRGVGV